MEGRGGRREERREKEREKYENHMVLLRGTQTLLKYCSLEAIRVTELELSLLLCVQPSKHAVEDVEVLLPRVLEHHP